jgi:hypothetical protein
MGAAMRSDRQKSLLISPLSVRRNRTMPVPTDQRNRGANVASIRRAMSEGLAGLGLLISSQRPPLPRIPGAARCQKMVDPFHVNITSLRVVLFHHLTGGDFYRTLNGAVFRRDGFYDECPSPAA